MLDRSVELVGGLLFLALLVSLIVWQWQKMPQVKDDDKALESLRIIYGILAHRRCVAHRAPRFGHHLDRIREPGVVGHCGDNWHGYRLDHNAYGGVLRYPTGRSRTFAGTDSIDSTQHTRARRRCGQQA
jgi:hypothetical protein